MKKKLLPVLLIPTCLFAATPLEGPYFEASGGYSYIADNISYMQDAIVINDTSYSNGYNLSASLGYKLYPWRFALGGGYTSGDVKHFSINDIRQGSSGNTKARYVIANIYYDFPEIVRAVAPFIGGGIGYSKIETNLANLALADNSPIYEANAGFNFNYSEQLTFDIKYSYLVTQRLEQFNLRFESFMASIGVQYHFNTYYNN